MSGKKITIRLSSYRRLFLSLLCPLVFAFFLMAQKGLTGKGTFYLLTGQRGHKGVTKK